MKVLFVFIVLFVNLTLVRSEKKYLNYLNDLDQLAQSRDIYTGKKVERIDALKNIYVGLTNNIDKFRLAANIYEEYLSFNIDSALAYALTTVKLSEELSLSYKNEAQLFLARSFLLAGAYQETNRILSKIKSDGLDHYQLTQYYGLMGTYYRYLNSYLGNTPVAQSYKSLQYQYEDSMLFLMDANSVHYHILLSEREIKSEKIKDEIKVLETSLDTISIRSGSYSYLTFQLAELYHNIGDLEKQIRYLSLSAQSDILRGVKENTALRELAVLLLEIDEEKKAYQYINIAMDDALFSKARLRSYEIVKILPIINHAYENLKKKQENIRYLFTWLVIGMLIFLLIMLYFIFRQKKQLFYANYNIENKNLELKSLNEELRISHDKLSKINDSLYNENKTQEEYIARYLRLSSNNICKLENYKNTIYKKALTVPHEEFIKYLKSYNIIEQELREFYEDFDRSFTKLHPNFVEQFNHLLKEDERYNLNEDELLNTELRVFALIRLGITDSKDIADFLNYSINTIYNYRTRVRNKAKISRDKFEQEVMKLGSEF